MQTRAIIMSTNDNEKPTPTGEFAVLLFLVQRTVDLLYSTGVCKQLQHGSVVLEFTVKEGRVVYARPRVEVGIKLQ